MWEAIARNRFRSRVLILVMGAVLIALGLVIGAAVDPRAGAPIGALAAIGLWIVLLLAALLAGDNILLSTAGAAEIKKDDAPQLWNVVEEMTIASGLGAMPRVFVTEDYAPNAFAVGRKPTAAAVAVTSGLLERLNRDELQGVIAHEIGHIANQDTRFLTIATVMVGSTVMISDVFLRSLRYGMGRRRTSRGGDGRVQAVIVLVAIAAAIVAPIVARLLYLACSRRREYLADASSAQFTRYPEGLASALEKIALKAKGMLNVNRTLAPLYIVNPLQGFAVSGLFSTHPPTETRIAVLRAMGSGAGYADYEGAFRKVLGEGTQCIGRQTLAGAGSVGARAASPEPKAREARPVEVPVEVASGAAQQVALEGAPGTSLEVKGLLDRLANFLLIPCPCGVNIKVPHDLKKISQVTCPRCGRTHEIPVAVPAGAANALPDGSPAPLPPLRYQRKSKGWESFRCSCGHTMQLSPDFAGEHIDCTACGRHIDIV